MTTRKLFEGIYCPIITPFTADDKVDVTALSDMINYLIEKGISGIVPCGTTGESATLTHAEHTMVIEKTVEIVAGRVPVMAGTGSNSTKEAVELTEDADKMGADGMLLIAPYYNRPSQDGLIYHFEAVAAATDKPIVMYNIPKRTGVNMEADTVAKLAKVSNITGIKEASGDLLQVMSILAKTEDFTVLTGDDNLLFLFVALGGHGGICASSHIFPDLWMKLYNLAREGKIAEARELHYKLLPLASVLFVEPNPAPLKAAMEIIGIPSGIPRLPMTKASESCAQKVKAVIENISR